MTDRTPNMHRFDSVAMGAHAGIEAAGLTNVGLRRPGIEEAFLIATLQRPFLARDGSPAAVQGGLGGTMGTVLIVADGRTGAGEAGVASRVMGTILTMTLVLWPVLYVAHVGDTRCYLLRAGKLRRLTADSIASQAVAAEAPERVDQGFELQQVLWKSLGGSSALPKPRFMKVELELGDRVLFCTHGLTEHLADRQISAVLTAHESGSACCATLVELAGAAGGTNNVTVLVADVRESSLVANAANGAAPNGDPTVAFH